MAGTQRADVSDPPAATKLRPNQALTEDRTLVYRRQKFVGPLDQQAGKGTFKCKNGDVYTGEYKSGSMHGLGVLRACGSNVGTYSGHWLEGKWQGNGVHQLVDGSTYYCEFNHDIIEGHGVYHGADGQEFRGQFSNGKRKGYGVQRLADGTVCHGEFNDHASTEQATLLPRVLYQEGYVYCGQCLNDKPEGHGVKYYADGRRYCGEFRRGKQQGQGQLESPGEPTFFGSWSDDTAGEPIWTNKSALKYLAEQAEASPDALLAVRSTHARTHARTHGDKGTNKQTNIHHMTETAHRCRQGLQRVKQKWRR
jgi:hypothetical protein